MPGSRPTSRSLVMLTLLDDNKSHPAIPRPANRDTLRFGPVRTEEERIIMGYISMDLGPMDWGPEERGQDRDPRTRRRQATSALRGPPRPPYRDCAAEPPTDENVAEHSGCFPPTGVEGPQCHH